MYWGIINIGQRFWQYRLSVTKSLLKKWSYDGFHGKGMYGKILAEKRTDQNVQIYLKITLSYNNQISHIINLDVGYLNWKVINFIFIRI